MAYNTDGTKTAIFLDLSLQNPDNDGTALTLIRSTAQPSFSLVKDVNTTPNGIAMNPTGLAYDNGTTITSTSWDDLSTRIAQLSAVAPNGLNATLLAINQTISIQNADTAPTRVINTSAGDTANIGEHFGVAWVGNALPFIMETLDATNLQVKDTTLELKNTITPLTTTMTASTLTSGASTKSWADIIAGSGSVGNLNSVLTNGNTATGVNATIGLTNSGVGYTSNPQLTLNNSNATAGSTTGVPSVEYYKSGRNAVAGDTIASQSFYGKDDAGTKTEFVRIETISQNVSSGGNKDGSVIFKTLVNNSLNSILTLNGSSQEIEIGKPIDMNGQSIKSSSGNMDISTASSTGTGTITIAPKTLQSVIIPSATDATNDYIKITPQLATANSNSLLLTADNGGGVSAFLNSITLNNTQYAPNISIRANYGSSAITKSINIGIDGNGSNSNFISSTDTQTNLPFQIISIGGFTGGSIEFIPQDNTGDIIFTGTNIESVPTGSSSGVALRIMLNGVYYRISLEAD